MKVNLGCGHVPIAGFHNVDKYAREADQMDDVFNVSFEDLEEVTAFHLIEHLSGPDATLLLGRALDWVRIGGTLRVEVPDMGEILRRGTSDPNWPVYIYGGQEHAGEIHRWGYTLEGLRQLVERTGWVVDRAHAFLSDHSQRPGMPCIEVKAHRES